MYSVEDNVITMVRGDTVRQIIKIYYPDGTEYRVHPGDVIRFAVKRKYRDAVPLILKTIDNSTLMLQIDPEDTKTFRQGKRGQYVYDIQITQEDGTVDTFIRGSIKILEEVE